MIEYLKETSSYFVGTGRDIEKKVNDGLYSILNVLEIMTTAPFLIDLFDGNFNFYLAPFAFDATSRIVNEGINFLEDIQGIKQRQYFSPGIVGSFRQNVFVYKQFKVTKKLDDVVAQLNRLTKRF